MNLGVDVVDIWRLAAVLDRSPSTKDRLFTPTEQRYCERAANTAQAYAGTLAAKEAVMKSLRLAPLVVWGRRIEIQRSPAGDPRVELDAWEGGDDVKISITHDGGVAIAVAFATGSPASDQSVDLGPWLERAGL